MTRLAEYLDAGLRNPRRFFRLVASRLLLSTGLCNFLTIRLGTYRIRFSPTRYAADLWYPSVDIFEFYCLPILRPGDIVVDVGANIGITALLVRKYVGPTGRVLAFEPHPGTFRHLERNIKLNGIRNIDLIMSAIDSSDGEVCLVDHRKRSTFSAIANGNERGVTVAMETLDHALAGPSK